MTSIEHGLSLRSVEIGAFDDMVFGVDPENLSDDVIDGQTIRPKQRRVGQNPSILSIHRRPLDPWRTSPIGPVDGAEIGSFGISLLTLTVNPKPERRFMY